MGNKKTERKHKRGCKVAENYTKMREAAKEASMRCQQQNNISYKTFEQAKFGKNTNVCSTQDHNSNAKYCI